MNSAASFPTFFMTSDGSSHFAVDLSAPVTFSQQKVTRSLSFVLAGTHVDLRNNTHALETFYQNTPVLRAQLRPSKDGVRFVFQLRADATPTTRMIKWPDGSARFEVDFPPGNYGNSEPAHASAPPAADDAP